MFTFLEERTRRLLATLTAVALLAGLSVIGAIAPAQAAPAGAQVAGGSSTWNLKDSWTSYIGGAGTITPALVEGKSSYGAPAGTFDAATKTGELAYPGSVRYYAHGGMLDLTISNVKVTVSGESGVISADFSGPAVTDGPKAGVKVADVTVAWPGTSTFTLDGNLSAEFGAVAANFASYVGAPMSTFTSAIVLPAAETATVLSAPATSMVGSRITLAATVAPAAAGTVSFTDGEVSLGSASVSGGAATLEVSGLTEGAHTFQAEFVPADPTAFETSKSVVVPHTVNAAPVVPVWTPQITVFAADGVTPLGTTQVSIGDTIVIKGSGFDPAANVGGRGAPIPSTLPQGTYVVFGSFAEAWRPSVGATSATRKGGPQAWALTEATVDQVPDAYKATVKKDWVALSATGTFTATLKLTELAPLAGGSYGVYTFAGGGVKNPAQELAVPVNFLNEVVVPPTSPATGTQTAISAAPTTVTAGSTSSLIATVTPAEAAGTVEFYSGDALVGSAPLTQGVANLKTGALPAGEHSFTARFVPADAALYTASTTATGVTVTAKAAVDGGTVTPPASAAGQLVWGVKASFTSYINGSGAAGTVSVSGGAAVSGSSFTFSQATKDFNGSTGTVGYAGAVRFTGHHGALDLKLSNPKIKVTGPGSGVLIVDVVGKGLTGGSVDKAGVEFATLNLAAPSTVNGATTWSNAAATLTAAGSEAFSGFYPAGTALDPVSFTVGADKAPGETPAATPPAAVAPLAPGTYPNATASVATVLPGGEVTVTGTGFGANTTGIELAVYSVRHVLATGLTADANGTVTATVKLPANLAAGVHTLSFEAPNGVKSQITITVEAPAAAAKQCVANAVSGASLSWGVKSAFRTYITGPIANGTVSANGVTDTGSTFRWTGGTGKFNTEANQGRVAFGGSVNFSGHGGILDLTLSNVRVQVTSASTGSLIADVSSTDMAGTKSSQSGVTVASLSLAGTKSTSGSTVTWTNASASLTAAGAKAFAGSYVAGEALDSVTFSFPLGGTVECDSTSGALASTGADGLGDAVLLALAAMTFGLSLVMVARRRRTPVRIG